MSNLRRVVLFVIAVVGAFVYICNIIPQIKSGPVDEEENRGSSPAELTAWGKELFMGDRAQCLTCHSLGEDPKARCPNQEDLGARAGGRKQGFGAAAYIVEALYDPNAFVVSGYPRNQMTPVNRPPIALSHDEILALIAFLNSLGGNTDEEFLERVKQAQDPWRKGLLEPDAGVEQAKLPILPGDAHQGEEVFRALGCDKCHRLGQDGGDIGPELTTIGGLQSAEQILQSILDPNGVIVKGYKQITVFWKETEEQEEFSWEEEEADELNGIPLGWLPDEENPRRLLLGVDRGSVIEERDIDLAEVECVGDSIVTIEVDGESVRICGQWISGDEASGVALSVLEHTQWVERFVPPEEIERLLLPASPMPTNFAELTTPRKIYDLVAYLASQKDDR